MTIFKTSDGVELFFQIQGEGRPVVFIHGWSADHTKFDPQFEELSKKYKVITYDLRGHGKSERPEKGLTLNRFAIDLKELMEYLELKDVALVGWSMGTSIIFEYVKTYGVSGLSSITIIDMTPKLINDDKWKLGLYHGKYKLKDAMNDLTTMYEDLLSFAEPFLKITIPYLSQSELQQALERFKNNTPHILAAMWYAMVYNDYREVLPKITVPTQIIYGDKSTLYSKETAEYLNSKIPNSKVIPFENCTHLLIVENPDKLTQVVDEIASI